MKKQYTRSIIGSSARNCALIILFQLYNFKAALFGGNSFQVGQYDPFPSTFILEEKLIQY